MCATFRVHSVVSETLPNHHLPMYQTLPNHPRQNTDRYSRNIAHKIGCIRPTLMFSTKYCSIFSWNSGSMKVASARDLVKETIKCQPWWWMMIFSWWWFLYGDDATPHLWVGHEEREHGRDVGHQTLEQGQGHCQEQGPRADLGHCHYHHVTTIRIISFNKNWATSHNYHCSQNDQSINPWFLALS